MAKNIVPSLRLVWCHSGNFTRNYSKWFHRRPVKVIMPEDLEKKISRRQKVNVERQVSFVETLEKPDPFMLGEIIEEQSEQRSGFEKNSDVVINKGINSSRNQLEFDAQDQTNSYEGRVSNESFDKPVFVNDERIIRAKKEKRGSPYDNFNNNASSGEENVVLEHEEGQISDRNNNQTHLLQDVNVDKGLSRLITAENIQRYKGRHIKNMPKTFLSKTDRKNDFEEHFSDDSDYDSVSSDEEPEKVEIRETVCEKSTTTGKSIKFTKLPDSDTKLSKFMLIAKSRKMKKKKELIVLEGKRLIQDFVNSGVTPLAVFFSRLDDISMIDFGSNDVQLYKITYKKLCQWSSLVTPPGVIGIFRTPKLAEREHPKDALPVTVICDNVRDPGNMGSIIRIVAGVGCQQIIAPKGCIDIWDTKVLRAAGGAHLRVPIRAEVDWSEVPNCIPYNHNVFVADNSSDFSSSNLSTPLIPYFSIDFSVLSHLVVIIGGETGLSKDAMSLVQEGGTRLNVPLSNGVESLNTSIALAVILFEMKKQMMHWSQKDTAQAVKL